MHLNLTYCGMLLTTLALVSACNPKDGGDSDPAPGSSSSSSVSASETGGEATDPGATDPGATDPGATDPGATDPGDPTGAPETTTATDGPVTDTDTGDDTGQAFPAECVELDPAVAATYTLAVVGWPEEPETTGKLEVACGVDSVTAEADTVVTVLTCDLGGEPHAATLTIAASPEGPVDWAAGDPVALSAEIWDAGDFGGGRNVQLRAADEALLLSASEAYIDEGFVSRFAPLKVDLVQACVDPNTDFAEAALRMDITPVDGPVVSIFSGHRGVVPIDADRQYAVDVEQAVADCCHLPAETKVLLRRVKPGG